MKGSAGIIVMGVSACGKSTIGSRLADRLSLPFLDGDTLHPPGNVEKMEAGIPLGDSDRWPWLEKIGERFADTPDLVIACSALKKAYRQRIVDKSGTDVVFVHLTGSRELLVERMNERTGHFMPLSLLDSQLAALEVPDASENAVHVNIDAPVDSIVDSALRKLEIRGAQS